MSRVVVIVPAAGGGARYGARVAKQYALLAGVPVLLRTLERLRHGLAPHSMHVVLAPGDVEFERVPNRPADVGVLRCGGATRAVTVANALDAIADQCADDDWIAVHDAARPCVPLDALSRLLHHLAHDPVGGLLAVPVADTLKRSDGDVDAPHVTATVPREGLWQAQTPQMFRFAVLRRALAQSAALAATDEAQAVESLGLSPQLVRGSPANLKITYPEDLALAAAVLAAQASEKGQRMTARIGTGFDVHALVEGRALVLGGVTIPHSKGLLGHSDADVLLHAIADALLGALALGDIGKHFPDSDAAFAGADSRVLLRRVMDLVTASGYAIGNVDATIIAQAPKVAPFVERMRANVASDLRCALDRISVKATTTERLGFTGREEGIAAQAAVVVVPTESAPQQ